MYIYIYIYIYNIYNIYEIAETFIKHYLQGVVREGSR